jgi:hypothetical protein
MFDMLVIVILYHMIRKIEGFLASRISHLTLAISLRVSVDMVASAVIRDKKQSPCRPSMSLKDTLHRHMSV